MPSETIGMHRAYSLLHVKALDTVARTFSGIATTPEPDRVGDIIEPLGVKFTNPLPLLLHHNHEQPVGTVRLHQPTRDGVTFEGTLPAIDEPPHLKARIDEAWALIKAKLIGGVSIGFRPMNDAVEHVKETGGFRFKETEIVELSLVTVPANTRAIISVIKSLDAPYLAAVGSGTAPDSSSVSGATDHAAPVARKDARTMTIAEQITQWHNTRAPKAQRMKSLMDTAADTGVTLDGAQAEEYDSLAAEVASIDVHIKRLQDAERINIATATPIPAAAATNPETALEVRGGNSTPQVQVKSQLPKGTAFTRYAMALAVGKGDMFRTLEHTKQWKDSTPEVELMVRHQDVMTKAAVNPGTIADATWAAPLAPLRTVTDEFLELLRPATLLGKINGLRRVPFNTTVPTQTAGGTYGWVGEGAPKPVGNLQLGTTSLGIAKAAGIIVLTEELVRVSTPSAESIVRMDMIAGIAQFLDSQFITPSVAAVTNVSPASVTNGTTPVTSAGTSGANALTDLKALVTAFTAANLSLGAAVFVMSEANAFALATAQNALGQPMFPTMNQSGGTLFGRPVVTTQAAGNNIVLIDAQGILYADDGGVTIDVSREASVEMNTTPTSPVVAATVLVSLWQQNLVGLRAERFINWKRARTESVKYVVQAYV